MVIEFKHKLTGTKFGKWRRGIRQMTHGAEIANRLFIEATLNKFRTCQQHKDALIKSDYFRRAILNQSVHITIKLQPVMAVLQGIADFQ